MVQEKVPKPPTGLRAPGKRLWASIFAEMEGNDCVPDAREEQSLERACRLVDHLSDLEAELKGKPLLVPGQRGTMVVNPLLEEIRSSSLAVERLLRSIRLELPAAMTPAQKQAQRAAQARWRGHSGRQAAL